MQTRGSSVLLLLAVLLLGSLLVACADCRDCCSTEGTCSSAWRGGEGICCGVIGNRPFCCPQDAVCVQRSARRFACRMSGSAGGAQPFADSDPATVDQPVYVNEPICGVGCTLGLIFSLTLCLPCCCVLGYSLYRRQQPSVDDDRGMARPWPPAPEYQMPPVDYSAAYARQGQEPAAPYPIPYASAYPSVGSGAAAGEAPWTGAPHKLDEGGEPYKTTAAPPQTAPLAAGTGPQAQFARSPPARAQHASAAPHGEVPFAERARGADAYTQEASGARMPPPPYASPIPR